MKKNVLYIIVTLFSVLLLLILVNSYFGWFGYEKWKYRRDTRGDFKESLRRDVYIRKMNFSISPDSLMESYNINDTLFYVEQGYSFGYFSSESTRKLNEKNNKYPYQLLRNNIDVVFLKKDNPLFKDSIESYKLLLSEPKIKDTLYFRLLYRKGLNVVDSKQTDTLGVVKVFNKTKEKASTTLKK